MLFLNYILYDMFMTDSQVHPTSIHITAALVKYSTPTGRTNNGVATNWLAQLAKKIVDGAEDQHPLLPIFVRKSQFR